MANTEYKKKLYDGLKSEGWISVDENKFYESLSDPKYVDKLYNGLKSEGWVSVDYDKFSQSLTSGGGDMGKQQGSTEPSEQSQDTTTTPSSETPLEQVEKPTKASGISLVHRALNQEKERQTTPKEKPFFENEFGLVLQGLDEDTGLGIGDFIDDMGRAISSGISQGDVVDDALSVMASGREASKEQIDGLIKANEELSKSGPSDEMINFQKTYVEGGEDVSSFLKGLWENPDVLPEIMVSSFAAMANKASLLSATGVVGGAAVGGVGAAPSAIASIPYALGAAGGTLETGLTFSELIGEELGDKEWNEENIREILNNEEKLSEIRRKAATRGAVIGVVDMLTGKLAGRVGSKIISKGTKASKVGGAAAAAGIEMVGGSGGEAAARGAIGQEMDVAEIGLEGIAEGPMAVPNIASEVFSKSPKTPKEISRQQKHKINGEDLGKEGFLNLVKDATPEQLSEMDIEIVNDPELESEISDKIQTQKLKNEVLSTSPNLNDGQVDRVIEIENRLSEISELETGISKLEKSDLNNELKEIYEQSKQPTETSTTSKTDNAEVQQEVKPKTEQDAKEQQGGEMRVESKPQEPKGEDVKEEIESVAKVSGVKAKNIKGLYDINRKMFGQNRVKSLASAVVMDRAIGQMAKRAGITKDEMYSKVKFKKGDKAPDGSLKQESPIWESTAKKGIGAIQQKAATPEQWVKMITDKGGKGTSQELDWIGLQDYLSEWKKENNSKSVPKEVVEQYIADNQIEIQEVTKGAVESPELDRLYMERGMAITANQNTDEIDAKISELESKEKNTKYSDYTLEGGENYREVLLTMPERRRNLTYKVEKTEGGWSVSNEVTGDWMFPVNMPTKEEAQKRVDELNKQGKSRYDTKANHKSSHWDESNILAHLRINERTLPNGERVLFIEEVQSDWAQDGKKKGFNEPFKAEKIESDVFDSWIVRGEQRGQFQKEIRIDYFTDSKKYESKLGAFDTLKEAVQAANEDLMKESSAVPQMPYKKTDQWVGMAMRRAIQMAAQEGFDRVAWVTGEQSAERYSLKEKVNSISVQPNESGRFVFIDMKGNYNVTLNVDDSGKITEDENNLSGEQSFTGKQLEDVVGKDMADKILSQTEESKFEGDGLEVGGEGMKAFYNSILPNVAKKEAQRFDKKAKVEVVGIDMTEKNKTRPNDTFVNGVSQENNPWATLILQVGGVDSYTLTNEILDRIKEKVAKDKANGVYSRNELSKNEELVKSLTVGDKISFEKQTVTSDQLSIAITPEMRMNLNSAVPLFQGEQGAMLAEDGNYIIYALTNPNVSTPLHELAHVYEHYLNDAERKQILSWAGKSKWDTGVSEKFARGFERYLASGKAPDSRLQKIFDKFKEWLTEIYNGIKGSDIDIELNNEMKSIYDKMLGGNETKLQDGKKEDSLKKSSKAFTDKPKSSGIISKAKSLIKANIKRFSDRQFNVKRLLSKSGLGAVRDRLVTSKGASGRAKAIFEKAEKKIFNGLSNNEKTSLDAAAMFRRIIAIENNRAERGLEPISHPNGITLRDAEIALSELEIGKIPTKDGWVDAGVNFKKVNARVDEYFKQYKNALDRALDSGLINKDMYDSMVNIDYQPRKFLQHIMNLDGEISESEANRIANEYGLSKPLIKSLSSGSEQALINDTEFLLSSYINSIEKRIFENEIGSRLAKELPKVIGKKDKWAERVNEVFKDNPIVGYSKSGNPKYKYDGDKKPDGFSNIYYYKNGEQNRILVRDDVHSEWLDNKKFINHPKALRWASVISGSALLKAMATGINPLFVITNIPRDFGHIIMHTSHYSDVVGVAIGQLTKDAALAMRDISTQSISFKEFVEYGGMMDFLHQQGSINDGNVLKNLVPRKAFKAAKSISEAMTIMNFYSEVGFRVAVYKRVLKKEMASINDKSDKLAIEDAKYKAAAAAREIIDFNQGGYITKDLEAVLPYINAAVQGTRVAAQYAYEHPVSYTLKAIQAGAMISGSVVGVSFLAMLWLGDDDEEGKTPAQIWSETMEGVNEFEKRAYIIIPTGTKDKDGNWEYARISKTQQARPIFAISDFYMENVVRELAGKEKIPYSVGKDRFLDSFFNDYTPIDPSVTSAGDLATRNPLLGASLEAMSGYDYFREKPLSYDIKNGKVPRRAEGYFKDDMPEMFKLLSDEFGYSPERSKHSFEKIFTSPTTNPYTGVIYALSNAAIGEKNSLPDELSKAGETIAKSVRGKFLKSSSDYNKGKLSDADKEAIDEVKFEQQKEHETARALAKKLEKNTDPTKNKEVMEFINSLPKQDRESNLNKIYKYANAPKSVGRKLDIIYERNPKVQAKMFLIEYGELDEDAFYDAMLELSNQGMSVSDRFVANYKDEIKKKSK